MKVHEKLYAVQQQLKAPKGQRNDFGKYNYRSCEDIVESVKPLLAVQRLLLTMSDDLVQVGDRYYIKATAKITDITDGEAVEVTAFAREEESKKGMDGSQVTGASSSYARKYALNGLFAIDDTKDSDATNTHGKEEKEKLPTPPVSPPKSDLPTPPSNLLLCEECGAILKPYIGANGKSVSIRAHAEGSRKKFGKVLCLDCIKNQ